MNQRVDDIRASDPGDAEGGELRELPKPKRPVRTVTLALMAVTGLLSLLLAFSLRHEASFATERSAAVELGAFVESSELAAHDGDFVRVRVALADQPTAVFERALESTRYRVTQVAPERWVIYPVPPQLDGPRFVPPSLVAGRLVRVSDLGVRFRGVKAEMAELGGGTASGWVLVDGEDPYTMGWVLALEALLISFAAFNLLSLARLLRPVS